MRARARRMCLPVLAAARARAALRRPPAPATQTRSRAHPHKSPSALAPTRRRWVLPFRPAWFGDDTLLVGDMTRGVAAFDAASGARRGLLRADGLTAIPSRLAAWAGGGGEGGRAMLAAATNSGRVHVFR